ncbi:hypothetical protein R1sor_023846 [Riccia sorocarpa]|uniref:F-box domain-containing protein n=1 Tax=Riccia sorocarpa TaxID=122646 RepID=A0ABD3GS27_9MARC
MAKEWNSDRKLRKFEFEAELNVLAEWRQQREKQGEMAMNAVSPGCLGLDSTHLPTKVEESTTSFVLLSEDMIVNIFSRLEEDPRHLARLACVCERFLHVVRNVCWKRHCVRVLPDLLPSPRVPLDMMAPPPGGWGGLMKLLVCCPGLKHAGVLLECWDFGLDRELGSSLEYSSHQHKCRRKGKRRMEGRVGEGSKEAKYCHRDFDRKGSLGLRTPDGEPSAEVKVESTVALEVDNSLGISEANRLHCRIAGEKNNSKEVERETIAAKNEQRSQSHLVSYGTMDCTASKKRQEASGRAEEENLALWDGPCLPLEFYNCSKVTTYTEKVKMQESLKKLKQAASRCGSASSEGIKHQAEQNFPTRRGIDSDFNPEQLHLASGAWNLSREQGNKLLASRFRADCLYICDWPGCEHPGEKRKYKLFRGLFKNFKSSHVWRNLKDMKSKRIGVPCAFCSSSSSWDMMTAFCLRRSFEYHDDGEPVVRAYVCENGHVSGAWTDRPQYTL